MICFKRVRELREEHEITQKEIGRLLGVDHSTYGGWERGRDLFPLERLIILANYYQVSIDYITGQNSNRTYPDLKKDINIIIMKQRIRKIRVEHHFTQVAIANTINTSHSTICAYEKGLVNPSLIYLYQLAQMFHVSIDYLLGRTDIKDLEEKEKKKSLVEQN